MTNAQTDQKAWKAAVQAALPYFRKQYAAPAGADRFAQSRAKHEAISHATALATAIAGGGLRDVRNPDRPEVKAALSAYRNA